MDQQRAIRITDDMSHLQFLLNTIGEQRDRALKAEAELRRCYKDLEQLTAERTDLKAMLADAGIRNAVLEKRLETACKTLTNTGGCPSEAKPPIICEHYLCWVCWKDWLEQEVQP